MKKIYSNEELIALHEKDIEILRNDLLTYGKKNKTVAEYDKIEISKHESKIAKLKSINILEKKYKYLTLIKHSDNFYSIDFKNASIGITLITDSTLNGIQKKWKELLNIINELLELDMDYNKNELKEELERIHGKLFVNFDELYNIRKEFL